MKPIVYCVIASNVLDQTEVIGPFTRTEYVVFEREFGTAMGNLNRSLGLKPGKRPGPNRLITASLRMAEDRPEGLPYRQGWTARQMVGRLDLGHRTRYRGIRTETSELEQTA